MQQKKGNLDFGIPKNPFFQVTWSPWSRVHGLHGAIHILVCPEICGFSGFVDGYGGQTISGMKFIHFLLRQNYIHSCEVEFINDGLHRLLVRWNLRLFFSTAQCEMSVDVLLCYMLCPAATPMDVLMKMT